ncbi:hypothetical protein L6452_18676 [Arctium lappa]|uniref:Uncharacterized protein n=1 Tax=Arctium lappa TaxID=4217 RepID=A0ACB9C6V5_ARCLA|nr:hypothetical protein L6452_18676 [Arctium lappa]
MVVAPSWIDRCRRSRATRDKGPDLPVLPHMIPDYFPGWLPGARTRFPSRSLASWVAFLDAGLPGGILGSLTSRVQPLGPSNQPGSRALTCWVPGSHMLGSRFPHIGFPIVALPVSGPALLGLPRVSNYGFPRFAISWGRTTIANRGFSLPYY